MNRFRAAYDVAWWWLHRWWIGIPLLLVLAGMIGWSCMTMKETITYEDFGAAPPLLVRVWGKLGLPLQVWPEWGFMGHGGYYLPRVFTRAAGLGLIWSLFSLTYWLLHRHEYEKSRALGRAIALPLRGQLAVGLLRLAAVSCGMVVLYIAAGRLIAIVLFPLLLLYFLLLMLYGLARLAVRGIRGARARRRAGESGPPGPAPDAAEPRPEHGAGGGEKTA